MDLQLMTIEQRSIEIPGSCLRLVLSFWGVGARSPSDYFPVRL